MPKGGTKRSFGTRNRETFEARHFFRLLSKEFPRPAEGSIVEAQRFLLRELANNPRPSVRPPNNDGKGSEAPAILFRRAIEKGKSEGHTEAAIVWAFIEFSEKGLWLNGSRFEQAVDDNASDFEKLFDGPSWQVERRIYWDRRVFEAVSREFEQRATSEEIHIQRLTKPLLDAIARFENWLLSESRLAEPRLSQLAYAAIELDRVLNSRRFRWGDQFVQQFKVAEVSHDRADCVADLFSQTYRGFYSLLDALGWHALIGCGDGKIDLPVGQNPKQFAEHIERFKRRAEGLLREAANIRAASEPSDAKGSEPAGSDNTNTPKPKAGYLGIILDETHRTVAREGRPDVKPIGIRSVTHWNALSTLVWARGGWTPTAQLADRKNGPIQHTTVATHISKVREYLKPLGLDVENIQGAYRLEEISSK